MEVFNVDLDEEVLAHLCDPAAVQFFRGERVTDILIEDEFVKSVFNWQMDHAKEHGKPATASVLSEEFDVEFAEPLTAFGDLLDRLRVRYMRNNAQDEMEKVANAYKDDPRLVPETMLRVGRELAKLVNPVGETYGNGDIERVLHEYDKRANKGMGPSLGYPELDDYFYGMRGVVMFIGPPKSYKSWQAGNSLLANVMAGRRSRLYSLELPAVETYERVLCLAANIPPWRFLKNQLTREDRKLLKEVAEILDDSGNFDIVKPDAGQRGIDQMVDAARNDDAEIIYFDQLQYIENEKGIQLGAGDHKDYWRVLNRARDLSDDGPLCFVHQFNRTAMFSDKMPEMQQAKGAAACEEVCSLIMGLWANKDMRRSGIVEFGAIASRHHMEQSWEISVDLTRGCRFDCLGVVENEPT